MLVIDTREPDVIYHALQGRGFPVEREQMVVGDYRFLDYEDSMVLITRKAGDLYTSLHSGHLQDELSRCVTAIQSYGKGRLFFILEGPWAMGSLGGFGMAYFKRTGADWFRRVEVRGNSPNSLAGIEVSLVSAGIHFLWTASPTETAEMIATLYIRGIEGWPTDIINGLPPVKLHTTKDSRVARLMRLWPSLREKQALLLLQEFGSIGKVVNLALTDPRKLMIPGIGQKSLKNLMEVLK